MENMKREMPVTFRLIPQRIQSRAEKSTYSSRPAIGQIYLTSAFSYNRIAIAHLLAFTLHVASRRGKSQQSISRLSTA
jgi:hypothetical protein